jgi:membrane protease YdiL (CAAX protease family)
MPADMRALRPWQAWLLFFGGGLVAQLAGLVIVVVVAVVIAARRGTPSAEGVFAAVATLPVLGAALVTTGLVLIAVALLVLRLARVPRAEGLGLGRPRPAAIAAACLGVVGLGPLSEVVLSVAQRLLPGLTLGTIDSINSAVVDAPLWVAVPVVALLPGLSEELFFRGAFQRAFGAGAKAIVISGVAFAAYHVDPHHALAILPVGLFLAWTAARTGTVWVPVIAHVVNNGLAITLTKLSGARSSEPGVITSPWWLVLGGLAMLAAAALWLHRATAGVDRAAPPG